MSRVSGKLGLGSIVFLLSLLALWLCTAALASQQRDSSPETTLPALPPNLAGRVEPGLLRQVLEASSEQEFRFIVELQTQADLSVLEERVASPEQMASTLQAEAARSQVDLLSFLEAELVAGRVTGV